MRNCFLCQLIVYLFLAITDSRLLPQNQKNQMRRTETGVPAMHLNRSNLRRLQASHQAKRDQETGIFSTAFSVLICQLIAIIIDTLTASGDQLQRRLGREPVHPAVFASSRGFGGNHAYSQYLLLGACRTGILLHIESSKACHRRSLFRISRF